MDGPVGTPALARTLTDADVQAVERAIERVLSRQQPAPVPPPAQPVPVPRPVQPVLSRPLPAGYVAEVAWQPPGVPRHDGCDQRPDPYDRHGPDPYRPAPAGPRTLTEADLQAIVEAVTYGRPQSGFARWGERTWGNIRYAHRSKTVQLAVLNGVLCGLGMISPAWLEQHRELAGIIVLGTNMLAVWLRLVLGQTITVPNAKIELPQLPKK